MSYRSFTLRKKQRPKEKVTTFDTVSIYSTLSKKPADLETTDIDLSAIRIFLGDGSHRTLSSTPSTTCGEILDKLLEKLGLSEQREQYGLQIQYQFAEPRVPDDMEMISNLNLHVWDRVDKIYLYKKSSTFVMMPKRKRVASYTRPFGNDGHRENMYENCAVSFGYRESDHDKCQLDPVLVNDKLASGFARAWSTGTDLCAQQPKDNESVPIETPPQLANADDSLSSPQSFNSYTLDRRQRRMNTLKRQTPVSPGSTRKLSPVLAKKSTYNRLSDAQNPQTDYASSQKPADKYKPHHFKLPITSPENNFKPSMSSLGSPDITISDSDIDLDSPSDFDGSLIQNPLHKRSMSEGCLLSAFDSEDRLAREKSSSVEVLRDSGFHDTSSTPSTSHASLFQPSPHEKRRRQSVSLEDMPSGIEATRVPVYNHSQSVPSLALHAMKANISHGSGKDDQDDVFADSRSANVNASSLKSYKSMELLSGEDFDTIEKNLCYEKTTFTPPGMNFKCDLPPPVPKRDSSYLDNCSVSDDYLLKQGKRLSHVLNINATIKSDDRGHVRSFFDKVGTMLTRKKKLSSTLSISSLATNSPTSPRPTLAYPITPPSAISSPDCPFPGGVTTSPRINCASRIKREYSQSSNLSSPSSPMLTPDSAPRSLNNKEEYDLVTAQPVGKFAIHTDNATRSLDRQMSKKSRRQHSYDVAVPKPVPARTPTPDYLQILSPSNSMPSIYENHALEDGSFYHTLPSSLHTFHTKHSDPYENHYIKAGANGSVTYDGSMIHDYQVPPTPLSLSQTLDRKESGQELYENTQIKGEADGTITYDGSMLHDYQVPPTPLLAKKRVTSEMSEDNDRHDYENTQIKCRANGAITFDGRDLHDYQTPPCKLGKKPSRNYENTELNNNGSPPSIPPHIPFEMTNSGSTAEVKTTVKSSPLPPKKPPKPFSQTVKSYPPSRGSHTGSYTELIADWIQRDLKSSDEKHCKSSPDLLGINSLEGKPRVPTHSSAIIAKKYEENMTTEGEEIEEIYDDMQLSQSESQIFQDLSGDEYMEMQSLPYPEVDTQSNSRSFNCRQAASDLSSSKKPLHVKASKSSKVETLQTQLSQSKCDQQPSRPLQKHPPALSSNSPSSTLGAPPTFVPTAPKPTNHTIKTDAGRKRTESAPQHSLVSMKSSKAEDLPPPPPPTSTIPSYGKKKSDSIPPPLPPINTIPRSGSLGNNVNNIRSPPPNTLQFKKAEESSKKQFSPFTSTPYLPAPAGFSGSSTPTSSPANSHMKKPMFPRSSAGSTPMTPLPPPIQTPPGSQNFTKSPLVSPTSRLAPPNVPLPPLGLPPNPPSPPNCRPLPTTPNKQSSKSTSPHGHSPKTLSIPSSFLPKKSPADILTGKVPFLPPGASSPPPPPPATKPLPSPPVKPSEKQSSSTALSPPAPPPPPGPPPFASKPLPSPPLKPSSLTALSPPAPPPPPGPPPFASKPLPSPPLKASSSTALSPPAPPPPPGPPPFASKPFPSPPLKASSSTALSPPAPPPPPGPPLPPTKPLPSPAVKPLLPPGVPPPPPPPPPPNARPSSGSVPPPPPLKPTTSKSKIQLNKEKTSTKSVGSSGGDFTAELFAKLKTRSQKE